MARVEVRVRVRVRRSLMVMLRVRVRVSLRLTLRLRLGVIGSVLVATPGSVHSTFIELRFLIIPLHYIHIPPRPLLFRRYKLT